MDVININNLSEPDRSQNTKKVQLKKQNDYNTVLSKKTSDNISISESAKAALEENKLLNIVENLPTVRQDFAIGRDQNISKFSLSKSPLFPKTYINKQLYVNC